MTLLEVYEFAKAKHEGQVRKGSGQPYIIHPLEGSYLVAKFKESKEIDTLLKAFMCHDLLEDTDCTFEELTAAIGPKGASLVLEVSNNADEVARIGKLEHQKKKCSGISNYGLILKLCDRLHNVKDRPRLQYVKDTIELMDYIKNHRKMTTSQWNVVHEILEVCYKAYHPALISPAASG